MLTLRSCPLKLLPLTDNSVHVKVGLLASSSRVLGLRSQVIGTVVEAEGPPEGPTENTSSAPSLSFSSASLWRYANFALSSFLVSFPRELRGDAAFVSWVFPPQKKQPGRRPKKRAQKRVLKGVVWCCLRVAMLVAVCLPVSLAPALWLLAGPVALVLVTWLFSISLRTRQGCVFPMGFQRETN